ncbi:MAG: hypothetical protein KDE22_17030 [Rhodobacterales bacterium]|nr:hypothetical protein [Rhodobacterales bacterium]
MTLKRALAVAATFAPLLAGPLLAGSALAQSSNDPAPAGDATVNALAMRPLPQGATLVVRPLDDSDASKEIQVLFERALRDRGYPLAADGRLILTFETRDRIGTWSSGNRRTLVEAHSRGGRTGGEDAQVRLNIYDSDTGGVLARERQETARSQPSEYRMDVTIDDRQEKRRLWQGYATADLDRGDGRSLTKAIVPVLVDSLGQTVRSRKVPLP